MQSVQLNDTLVVFGDGVSGAQLKDVANCFAKVNIEPNPKSSHALMLIASVDADRLARAFEKPAKGYFEIVEPGDRPKDIFKESFSSQDLSFSFSSTTVYRLPVAHHITNALFAHTDLKDELRNNIEMALHEAMVNGVVHGNLELGHIKKDTVDSLQYFDEEAESRLLNPIFSGRKIEVSIQCYKTAVEIKVMDQGKGFAIDKDRWKGMPWRGINLIESLASSVRAAEVGAPLTMTFNRESDHA